MRVMVIIWMVCLSTILHLHDSTTIVTIRMVDNVLYTTIREVDGVLALHVTPLITISLLMKLCVVLVIMHSILKVERISMFIIMITTMTKGITTSRGRVAENMAS